MEVIHHHTLGQQQAHERVNNLLGNLQKQHADTITNPQMQWNEDNTVMDFTVNILMAPVAGQVTVSDTMVSVKGELPFMAMMFRSTIETLIKQQLNDLLK